MDESIANRLINYYDKDGLPGQIRFGDLFIEMGEDRLMSLSDCLLEEQQKVAEFRQQADQLSKIVRQLNPFFDEIERDPVRFNAQAEERAKDIQQMPYEKRIQALNTYYTVNSSHARILQEVTSYLLAGSEGDHSAHSNSLLQFALNFTCRMLRAVPRKTKRAAAVHSIEAARGAAKNGLNDVTIIGTLLHDVLEERQDDWTERLINRELQDPSYGDCCGKNMKEVPVSLRHQIIQKYIDAYNDHTSGIFFQIALSLYSHVRHFPWPARYYETLNSIMEIVAKLSRTRDTSYYTYLRNLLYPKANVEWDAITRDRLLEELLPEFSDTGPLLDAYVKNVQCFYQTAAGGEYSAKEEVRRNAFREILAKILDRMNNTRDMERGKGFSTSKRLYGTGFKNIYMVQAIEDKFRRPSFNTEERRLIEVKFINKPKVSALYQILEDIEYLEKEYLGREMIAFLERELDRYKATRGFRRLTPPGRGGYFDGLIYLFNEVTLGRKSNLDELEKHRDRQAEVLVAFKAILEAFLLYPALIRDEMRTRGLRQIKESTFRAYRIEGMGPGLENRSDARQEQAVDQLNLRSFCRRIMP